MGLSDVFALQISPAIKPLARSFGTPQGRGVSSKPLSLAAVIICGRVSVRVRENLKFAPSLAAEISSFLGRQAITGQY